MSAPTPDRALRFASRTEQIEPFLAMEVVERAGELEREGARIAHLEVGDPEFDPPPAATQAAIAALERGETGYTDSRGMWSLREAIVGSLARRFGISVSPERVLVTQGTSSAMTLVFAALVEPGDEVVIPTPHYPCYPNFVRFCGGVPIFVPTEAADGWQIDPERVRAAITPRTRAIVVASPANPTGAVQPRAIVEALARLGPPIVSDEIYGELVYGGARATSILEVGDQGFALDGVSKRYAMTGFRLGWVVAPEAAMRRLHVLQQNLFISVSPFVQQAGIAALEQGGAMTQAMRESCNARRERLVGGLRRLGFGIERDPEGAFYVLADARRFGADSRALAFRLLERAHVGTTPGIDFGPAAEGRLRFCYAVRDETIDTALERLEPVLRELDSGGADSEPGAARDLATRDMVK
ncbi:MAG: pyridoxal phosphate-dependent aminotransferase [Deltaproteobacteria bacterium]|jgi:aspartate/methionine/tyrosine aminotransferase|nr:pyridoxal phosphate-dependent aminotransferase [Deltaproteobacteria bacterium]MBW2496535.1 pyridoxal phosphate-dependent aminotransferase [Deltaproteobacteria bacterium]